MKEPSTPNRKMFSTHQEGETLNVAPTGDARSSRFADIQIETNQIRATLGQCSVKQIVIDLGQLDYFGSEVIGAIIAFSRDVTNRGGGAALCRASSQMQQTFDDMNLLKLWPHFDAIEEAMQSVRRKGGAGETS